MLEKFTKWLIFVMILSECKKAGTSSPPVKIVCFSGIVRGSYGWGLSFCTHPQGSLFWLKCCLCPCKKEVASFANKEEAIAEFQKKKYLPYVCFDIDFYGNYYDIKEFVVEENGKVIYSYDWTAYKSDIVLN